MSYLKFWIPNWSSCVVCAPGYPWKEFRFVMAAISKSAILETKNIYKYFNFQGRFMV